MEFVAFWIALAAVFSIVALNSRRNLELRHDTIRLMLEKGEKVDPAVLESILKPADPYKSVSSEPGSAYKAMRVIGTILLFVAPGLALLMILPGYLVGNVELQAGGVGLGALLALVGTALHFASRYVTKPQNPL